MLFRSVPTSNRTSSLGWFTIGYAFEHASCQDAQLIIIHPQVYKSPDCFKAFAAAKDLIDSLVSGKVRPHLLL